MKHLSWVFEKRQAVNYIHFSSSPNMFCQWIRVCQRRLCFSQPEVRWTWQLPGWLRWGQCSLVNALIIPILPNFCFTAYSRCFSKHSSLNNIIEHKRAIYVSFTDRLAVWRSAGKMSSSVWIVLIVSLGVGVVMMYSTVWTTVMRKIVAKVGVSVISKGFTANMLLT